ncbi:sugar transferase [Pontibacter sp. Tf4]|uniref:sugar transferase n=1 Tax=Pontibacter sp. Tf4 TaxID=2761620 RepID=UPI00162533CA|nr:sugar transferase [Pontibacter sp. Tf4]MBB6612125.1 sugar transferase [Pontibacter sp. Tf4]
MLAPILLFTYKRVDSLKQTIGALQRNNLVTESDLFVFSDGAKNKSDIDLVDQVRTYLRSISGFKSITIKEAPSNLGLANSIIAGVNEVISEYGKVIVLEDDLLTSANFLTFMNQALETFQNDPRIYSISGYTAPIKVPADYPFDNYFTRRASSWGWATWKDRWTNIDWEVSDYRDFSHNLKARYEFNKMGSDMSHMLSKYMNGKIDSWAIRWCYYQFKMNTLSVYPTLSKVSNIGSGQLATNTNEKYNRFTSSTLDTTNTYKFIFNQDVKLDKRFIKQFVKIYSLKTRIYYKIKNILGSGKSPDIRAGV